MSFLSARNVRVLLAVAGAAGAIFAPPWVPLLAILALSVRYAAWEVMFIGLLVDFLWFTPNALGGFFGFVPLFTLTGIALVWGFEPLRREFMDTERGLL